MKTVNFFKKNKQYYAVFMLLFFVIIFIIFSLLNFFNTGKGVQITVALIILFGYILWIQKHAELKYALDEKYFNALSKQTGSIIFEWDFGKNKIKSISNFKNIFGRTPLNITGKDDNYLSMVIHYSDLPIIYDIADNIYNGNNIENAKFRIKHENNYYLWCALSGIIINDATGNPYKLIGSIRNIDKEEKEAQALRDKAQKDLLTDLYNRVSTEILISEYLNNVDSAHLESALLMIDLDNFKSVNDSLGHQFGDKVLADAADKLKKIFKPSDIIGRVGGDEFLVFIKNISGIKAVEEIAKSVCVSLPQAFTGEKVEYKVSASIGIALYPQHGNTFNQLYKLADLALYDVKHKGKNSFTIYNNAISEENNPLVKPIEDAERFIANHFSGDYIHSIFEMLYETKDIHTTINMILNIVGKKFKVDRCYIFEVSKNGDLISNTYEWCAPNINPEIESLQNISLEDMSGFFSNYNADGFFYCNDISKLDDFSYKTLSRQGIKSLVHSAIFEENVIKGFIGFDECKTKRIWSVEEIANLGYISRILSIFILKNQISKSLLEAYNNYTEILDNMNGYVYVIDPHTFKTLYINNAIRALGAESGEKCHKIAFFSDTPCANCPAKKINKKTNFASEEIYSLRVKTWVKAEASKITWAGYTEAILVCCLDITEFKKSNPENQNIN